MFYPDCNNVLKKILHASDWLKTSAFSCNVCKVVTQVQITNSMDAFKILSVLPSAMYSMTVQY